MTKGVGAMSVKAKIIVASLTDMVVDLLLPIVIYALLEPTGLSPVMRLSIAGMFVGAKACGGHIASVGNDHDVSGGWHALARAALIAICCAAITVLTWRVTDNEPIAMAAGGFTLITVEGARFIGRRRKLDGFALLVLIEIAATLVLTWVSHEPRFILMRPSFYTAIAGIYVLYTVWTERPFMMQVTRPIAAAGDAVRAAAFDRAGRESRSFRRTEQAMTLGLALVLFGEAALRIATVMALPPEQVLKASLLSQLPGLALFVAYLILIRLMFVPRAIREVDAMMPQ